ncbi:malto-oligosyltrehalose synthase [Tellurirhabdus bombi]|uniref:malto-oligosyltrehalose synthase n=1 Tax=Tellurirhabdus bombi TaxID=2907205 RepID=UPI001F37630E|nr:malto-oligosyltrehalose synthase [Tellurirhabdus bombi]
MYNPVSTYRIQFHKAFTFSDFENIIAYLQKLGVGTIYASPLLESTPGSTHGYDGVNPHQIHPEIGTEKRLKAIGKKLQKNGMGWLQDIVPNHMAYHVGNPWLMDVLEKGPLSQYAPFFDSTWTSSFYQGRIMIPFLGAPLAEVIEKKQLKVSFQDGRLVLRYFENDYPLHLRSYATILQAGENPGDNIQQLLDQLTQLQRVDDAKTYALEVTEFQQQLASQTKHPDTKKYLQSCLKAINGNPEQLQQIADSQVYELCYHQDTDQRINFRRFFTVTSLICLNIQDEAVFQHYHQLIKSLQDIGIFQGLRIDHIDGLYDPSQYLARLRELTGEETYLTVEKILEPGEPLPQNWPIQGSTGYEFLALVNNLFTRQKSKADFTAFYNDLVGKQTPVQEQIHQKKAHILNNHMVGELENLCQFFIESTLVSEDELNTVSHEELKEAIGAVLIHCPVYRYYGNRFPLDSSEVAAVKDIFDQVRKGKPKLATALGLLEASLLHKPLDNNPEYNHRALSFYQRLMQFTGPLMAKGVEDTLMYTYNRFIGHNEVGDAPESFGLSISDFHQQMEDRQKYWPLALNATSTHDTKRGEDVRARLNVLTDISNEWFATVQEWQQINAKLKKENSPDENDEYFIYQTLIGAYPMPEQGEDDFGQRIQAYLEKALREAKRHSQWDTPDEAYEEAAKAFATNLLNPKKPFWKSFQKLHRKVADFGIINSLAQVLLKATCPGVPDIYQGTELWDLSLVDPDNRRPVDYNQRQQWLESLEANDEAQTEALLTELWQNRYDARIKLWLIYKLLNERKQQPDVFAEGQYIPLTVKGAYKEHVMAFARRHKQTWYVTAVPLHLAFLSQQQKRDALAVDWKDTRIVMPPEAPLEWCNELANTSGKFEDDIAVNLIFKPFPLALLKLQQPINNRSAGILLSLTSLASPFGIGDMGPAATEFADFLSRSRQTYWQLLPLNPTEQGQGHSPYSSISSMAGNTLLISPDLLAQEGLLDSEALVQHHLPPSDKTDYTKAERVKNKLFDEAYQNFSEGRAEGLQVEFNLFCEQEAYWLDDFALFVVLKQKQDDKAWFQWPKPFKLREPEALATFTAENQRVLDQTKWLQFIFARQWKDLKAYCNNLNIKLFGDLPFYTSYDSADVWANPSIFSVDEEGKMIGVAGVPPDYFNAEGQLWGMPVFRWDVLKEQGYSWWIDRLRKNMELYDLLRLDHFRAFANYWEVPSSEKTAINGEWRQGPGSDFFLTMQQALGELPFVAEDLGDINDAVYELRDEFMLPGMKVLQFAFTDDMIHSVNVPHNFTPIGIAYTGTHDNNTTRGWYRQDATKEERKMLERYTGYPISDRNVHQVLSRMAYACVAKIVILPLQDVLGLDESARMNTPASTKNNWVWRLLPDQITPASEVQLREWVLLYGRG